MSQNDKTKIFSVPQFERSVVIPKPGGGRSGSMASQQRTSSTGHSSFLELKSINPLVTAATTLLSLQVELRASVEHSDVQTLQKKLVNEIKRFEQKAIKLHLTEEIIVTARYILCCCIDESVLNTPWGTQSNWVQQSLLSTFHKELFGGVKFFEILQKLQSRVHDNLYLLELMYLCLSLGFEGKFSIEDNGKQMISDIRDKLYRDLKQGRKVVGEELSPNWQKPSNLNENSLIKLIPLWVVLSISLAFMSLIYTGFRVWLFSTTTPVVEQLDKIIKPESIPLDE